MRRLKQAAILTKMVRKEKKNNAQESRKQQPWKQLNLDYEIQNENEALTFMCDNLISVNFTRKQRLKMCLSLTLKRRSGTKLKQFLREKKESDMQRKTYVREDRCKGSKSRPLMWCFQFGEAPPYPSTFVIIQMTIDVILHITLEQFPHCNCVHRQHIGMLCNLMIQHNSMCPAFHFA